MEESKPTGFRVKNYHKMSLDEIEKYIKQMKEWLFTYQNHPNAEKVRFALKVAISAKILKKEGGADDVVDSLT